MLRGINKVYIAKLILHNFQIHEHLEMDFDPTFNVIRGSSDRGKTAVVRAIAWVFNNTWDKSFRRTGSKETSATVFLDNGTEITRYRSDKDNLYILNGKTFVNAGDTRDDIPAEVQNELGTNKKFSNIADQFSAPYMMFDKDNVKAKILFGMVGGNTVESSIKALSTDITRTNNELSRTKKETIERELKLKEYDSLELENEKLKKIDCLIKECSSLEKKLNECNDLIKEEDRLRDDIEKYKGLIKKKDLTPVQEKMEQLEKAISVAEKVFNLLETQEETSKKVALIQQQISKLIEEKKNTTENIKLIFKEFGKCPLCESDIENIDHIMEHIK